MKKVELELLDNISYGRIKCTFNNIVILKIPNKYIEDKYFRYNCMYLGYNDKICQYMGKIDENLKKYDEIFVIRPNKKNYLTLQEINDIMDKNSNYTESINVILNILGYNMQIKHKKETILNKILQFFKPKNKIEIENISQNNIDNKIKKSYLNSDEFMLLFLKTKAVQAKCIFSNEGFIVLKGSKLSAKIFETVSDEVKDKRKQSKIDKNNILKENIKFSSSSGAGSFVVGYTVSGYEYWYNKDNKKLKEILKEVKGEDNGNIRIDKE